MGLLELTDDGRYDMSDLGYLDQTRDPALESILRLSAPALVAPIAFIGFGDLSRGLLVPKAVRGGVRLPMLSLSETLGGRIRERQRVTAWPSCEDTDTTPCRDIAALRGKGALGAPVFGPAGEPVGAIVVVDHLARRWTVAEERSIRDLASLVSQQILLKAALMTLKLVVRHGPLSPLRDGTH